MLLLLLLVGTLRQFSRSYSASEAGGCMLYYLYVFGAVVIHSHADLNYVYRISRLTGGER